MSHVSIDGFLFKQCARCAAVLTLHQCRIQLPEATESLSGLRGQAAKSVSAG